MIVLEKEDGVTVCVCALQGTACASSWVKEDLQGRFGSSCV